MRKAKQLRLAGVKTGSRTPLLPLPRARLGRITSPHLCNTPSQGSLVSLQPNVQKRVILPAPRKIQKKKSTSLPAAGRFGGGTRGIAFFLLFLFLGSTPSSTSVLESTLAGWLAPCLTLCCREAFSSGAASLCGCLGLLPHGKRRRGRAEGLAPGLRRFVCTSRPSSCRTRDCRRQSQGNRGEIGSTCDLLWWEEGLGDGDKSPPFPAPPRLTRTDLACVRSFGVFRPRADGRCPKEAPIPWTDSGESEVLSVEATTQICSTG